MDEVSPGTEADFACCFSRGAARFLTYEWGGFTFSGPLAPRPWRVMVCCKSKAKLPEFWIPSPVTVLQLWFTELGPECLSPPTLPGLQT